MPECSRGGRACTSGREEEEEEGGQKKAGDKRGQFRSQQKLLKSKPAPDHKIKKKKEDDCPPSSQRGQEDRPSVSGVVTETIKLLSPTERGNTGVLVKRRHAHTKYIFSVTTQEERNTSEQLIESHNTYCTCNCVLSSLFFEGHYFFIDLPGTVSTSKMCQSQLES